MPDLFVTKQSDYYKSRTSVIIRIISILIVSTVGISDSAVAGVLDKYCLSRVGQTEPIEESQRVIPQEPIPPFIGSVDHLPELYRKSCNAFSRFFDACTRETLFYYSPALERVFFQGYRPTRWGRGFRSFRNRRRRNKVCTERIGEFWFSGKRSRFEWSFV